jgi:CYTH domain-containing protein
VTSSLKYARLERERRFLLARAPDRAAGDQLLQLEDRYLDGTRLRLRLVRRDGQEPVYKLGQKVPVDSGHPSTVAHTTLYLDRDEYESLRTLPGRTLTKTRTVREWHGLTLAVDVFTGKLEGLVLAEVELGELGELPAHLPLPTLDEVTEDERFTGGALASASREQLCSTLRQWSAG